MFCIKYGLNENLLHKETVLFVNDCGYLMIRTMKNCFTQFNTRSAVGLLLTFFICLHNQLSSIHSITTY